MGPSIWQLLIVLAIVVLLFGTKRLKSLGADLGDAVKGFRSSIKDGEKGASADEELDPDKLAQQEAEQEINSTNVNREAGAELSDSDSRKAS